ncbi:hypothetical protein CKM354_000486300 [Cercospora kikuchii]|uniref:BTB domain-containing protein n=1 Tax=Cercospora kikuchii TaxID=84275 RepID=A0A9P3CNC6_9PEZI|nr:uncharacterized protein CKM354_000486300 [Cercospora kikuchii]GIZ41563.1 hypothetical protein CKM354_000486300 [Cercospora kikuchii]
MAQGPITECIRALQSDRLITLNISDAETSFSVQVQQKVLEAASPWFQKALRDDRFVEGQNGAITFADDDIDAWKIALYWLLHREIPEPGELRGKEEEDFFVRLARCWVLGDKYNLTRLQNDIMFRLLKFADQLNFALKPAQYKDLLKIVPAGSQLMQLLAEEVAAKCYFEGAEIALLDGSTGFWPVFVTADRVLKDSDDQAKYDYRLEGI